MDTKSKNLKRIQIKVLALKLIADMRTYEALLEKNKSNSYLNVLEYFNYAIRFSDLQKNLEIIKQAAETGLIELDEIADIKSALEREIPEAKRFNYKADELGAIETLEKELYTLSKVCPKFQSLCMELMNFYTKFGIDSFLNRYICDLLALLNPDKAIEERVYLTNRCTNSMWYMAFFFVNPRMKNENHTANFNALIRSTQYKENPPRPELLNRALVAYRLKGVADTNKILKIFRDNARLDSILKKKSLESAFYSKGAKDISQELYLSDWQKTIDMFKEIEKLLGESKAIELYAQLYSESPEGDELITALESYLRCSERGIAAAMLIATYRVCANQKREETPKYFN